jgi:replicative DNA helicase
VNLEQEAALRLPPQNLDAERSVLGSMLRDNACIPEVVQIVRPTSFYTDAHQKVAAAAVALWDANSPVDLVTLAEDLRRRGHLEDVGGMPYLARLWDAAPTAANAVYYAQIVRDKAIVRSLVHASTEILRDAYDQAAAPEELLQAAEQKILAIGQAGARGTAIPIAQAAEETRLRIDARMGKSGGDGLKTGLIDLDDYTGGLQPQELILVGARPGTGKTSFALALVNNLSVAGDFPVFVASLEQPRVELVERLACMVGQVNSHGLRIGRSDRHELRRVGEALDLLETRRVFIDDTPSQSVLQIAANARRLKARHDIRAVFIDYLGLIEPEDRRVSRSEQIGAITRRLKNLAKELQIPVVLLAQLNREVENRNDSRPRLADLRDSGAQEQDADVVLLLHQPKEGENLLNILIAKQRNGPVADVRVVFRKEFYRFENWAPDPDQLV